MFYTMLSIMILDLYACVETTNCFNARKIKFICKHSYIFKYIFKKVFTFFFLYNNTCFIERLISFKRNYIN